jgi:hypothetical protein
VPAGAASTTSLLHLRGWSPVVTQATRISKPVLKQGSSA